MSITRCRLPQNPSRIINTKLHFCSYDIFRLLYVCRNLITACFLCLVFFLFLLHFTLISPLCMCVKQENLHSQIRVQFILAIVWKYLVLRGTMLKIEIYSLLSPLDTDQRSNLFTYNCFMNTFQNKMIKLLFTVDNILFSVANYTFIGHPVMLQSFF